MFSVHPWRNFFVCSIFLFFVSFHSIAQHAATLQGTVLDASSKETITGATIYLLSDKNTATVTDEKGFYIIHLPSGKQRLVCSFIGMLNDTFSVTIDSSETSVYNILLKTSDKQLQTVVIEKVSLSIPIKEHTNRCFPEGK